MNSVFNALRSHKVGLSVNALAQRLDLDHEQVEAHLVALAEMGMAWRPKNRGRNRRWQPRRLLREAAAEARAAGRA